MEKIKDVETEDKNAEAYINKLYDHVQDKHKQLITDAYAGNTAALDAEKQSVQQQTDTNLQRTDVEAQKVQQDYKPANTSDAVSQQAALSMGNQQKKNTATLRSVQADADAEIERRRLLLGEQFSAAIKQAQAENDMARAEQLYAEAKQKDAQIRALKTEAGKMLAETGDNSLLLSLLEGGSTDTVSGVGSFGDAPKNAELIDRIYDNANESAKQQTEGVTAAILSQLKAQREQKAKETDKKLTETYVNALRQGKNESEVQNAYGMGSGNRAQARLARQLGTTEDMTRLRGVQTGTDAAIGQKVAEAIQGRNEAVTDAVADNERKRVQALYDAAAAEEQTAIDNQRTVGKALAKQGDYSILGKLYGLTQDQIDRLQGTGAYAPAVSENPEEEPFGKDEEPEAQDTGATGGNSGTGPISAEGLAQLIESGDNRFVPPAFGGLDALASGNTFLNGNRTPDVDAVTGAAPKAEGEKRTLAKILELLAESANKSLLIH